MTITLVVSLIFFVPFCVILILVFATGSIFPNFVRLKLNRILNSIIGVFGFFVPLIFFTFWAATHDIYNDYISAPLFQKLGRDLPGWYDASVHACPLEWGAFQIAFLLMLLFHMLLFARFIVGWKNKYDG